MATSATSKASPTSALQAALATSIAEGTFADTAYYLYSERGRNWKIGKPRPVYANSAVMKAAVPGFYNTSHSNHDSAAVQWIDVETEDYAYESDSDIDDYEAEGRAFPAGQPSPPSNDDDDGSTRNTPSPLSAKRLESPARTRLELVGSQCKYYIVVPDIAATTLQALVHFVYTGTIYFAPLKSQGPALRIAEQVKHRKKNPFLPPLCSPKSIYRLADTIGLQELKLLAEKDIKTKITVDTVAREIFSRFSSWYTDILDMELEMLYSNSTLVDTLPKVLEVTASIAQGSMPYSEKALSALLTKLSTFLVEPRITISSPQAPQESNTLTGPPPPSNPHVQNLSKPFTPENNGFTYIRIPKTNKKKKGSRSRILELDLEE